MDTHTARGAPPEQRFRELFTAHHDAVLRFARRRTSSALADDVAAETFLVAWRRLEDVPTRPGEALPWLYAVARHCLLNAQRSDRRQDAVAVRISDGLSSGLGDVAHLDVDLIAGRADLAAAWRRLSATDQEVLALALWEDLTSPQAARVLRISPTAYRLRLSRARRSLRRLLEPQTSPTPEPALRAAPSPQECTR